MSHRIPEVLKVDVGAASTPSELHSLLAQVFHFPDYYGQNWDAFDECIRDVQLPPRVEIIGLEALRARLPREAGLLQRCIADFIEESLPSDHDTNGLTMRCSERGHRIAVAIAASRRPGR